MVELTQHSQSSLHKPVREARQSEFKVTLLHTASLEPAWAIQDPVARKAVNINKPNKLMNQRGEHPDGTLLTELGTILPRLCLTVKKPNDTTTRAHPGVLQPVGQRLELPHRLRRKSNAKEIKLT